ncbi:MAG: ankyrin repeat domain-containing protein [Proteobacteria bacterium]|nr:ankyrin repeat domain-containing protein [Pseudomonadota bacterium]
MPNFKRPSDDFNQPSPNDVATFFATVMNNDLPATTLILEQYPDAAQWRDRAGNTPLMMAVIFGTTHQPIIDLLIQNGADVNAQNAHGGNALARAAHFGHKKLVEQLLTLGADVYMKDEAGQDAVEWANKNGQTEIAALLRARQKSPRHNPPKHAP